MKKGELKENKDYLNYKTILTTILCTLVGMLFVLCLIYVGISMADSQRTIGKKDPEDIEIIPVSYEQQSYGYMVKDWQIAKDDKTPYLFTNFETKYMGKNYAVLNSKTQLDNLTSTLKGLGGVEEYYPVDSTIFDSGSVIAVALEDEKYYNYNVSSITRDADYNLQINIDAFKTPASDESTDCVEVQANQDMTDCAEIADPVEISSMLYLLSVQNIQPRQVNVVINEAK